MISRFPYFYPYERHEVVTGDSTLCDVPGQSIFGVMSRNSTSLLLSITHPSLIHHAAASPRPSPRRPMRRTFVCATSAPPSAASLRPTSLPCRRCLCRRCRRTAAARHRLRVASALWPARRPLTAAASCGGPAHPGEGALARFLRRQPRSLGRVGGGVGNWAMGRTGGDVASRVGPSTGGVER